MVRHFHRLQSGALLVGALLCAALSGCRADEASVGAPNKPEQQMESLSTGQIASVIATINQGEVKQAQTALARLEDETVRGYAEKLSTDHRAQQAELTTLLGKLNVKEESSAAKSDLEQYGQKLNRSIEQEPAERLASAFLDEQVAMHKRALATVEQLLSQAQEPELRTYLESFRVILREHLEEATQLRKRYPEMESRL